MYKPTIGLEIHVELKTKTKMFCGCLNTHDSEPNTNICPICLAHPGTLPVANKKAIEAVLKLGIALNGKIPNDSKFDRKNYFYPDLPKGYQISQYEEPICANGFVEIDLEEGGRKRIGVTRIHMEEDAGKSIHDVGVDTLVDVNRCGVPLIEIVSEPDIRSPREAYQYVWKIRQIVTYLGICDGNMEEGSLRCDANVSVRRRGEEKFGTKTEVKNMNSVRNVERALEFEIDRQISLLNDGGSVVQETLLWDADQGVTYSMRSKEEAHDYRYFPDPDLVPVLVDENWKEKIRGSLPEHPTARRDRFVDTLGLPRYDADVLTAEKEIADYFEQTLALLSHTKKTTSEDAKAVSNWVMTDVLRVVSERKIGIKEFPVQPHRLSLMITLIQEGTISGKIAKDVFEEMLSSTDEPKAIVEKHGWVQISDTSAIEQAIEEILALNPSQVATYLGGSQKVFGFLVGETMKKMKGKGNPKLVNEILKSKLEAKRS